MLLFQQHSPVCAPVVNFVRIVQIGQNHGQDLVPEDLNVLEKPFTIDGTGIICWSMFSEKLSILVLARCVHLRSV